MLQTSGTIDLLLLYLTTDNQTFPMVIYGFGPINNRHFAVRVFLPFEKAYEQDANVQILLAFALLDGRNNAGCWSIIFIYQTKLMFNDQQKEIITTLDSNYYTVKLIGNTHSGSSGGFVNARKTQFTKIVRIIKISKYLSRVKELVKFNIKNAETRHVSDLT